MKVTLALVLSFLILTSAVIMPYQIAFAEKNDEPKGKDKHLVPDQYIVVFKEGNSKK